MIDQQTFQGNWDEVKDKLRGRWSSLTDDDLFNGNVDQLVGVIQRKTGEPQVGIEQFFEQLSADGAATFSRAGETFSTGAGVPEAKVEPMGRQRPAHSLAVCFVAGVITGVVVTLLWQWR